MNRVFLDTNILLDILLAREPHLDSAVRLMTMAERGELEVFCSSVSLVTIAHVLGRRNNAAEVRSILRRLRLIIHVLPTDERSLDLAIESAFADFEDAVQYHTALAHRCTVIVTRNQRDFVHAILPVMSAAEYLNSLH